MIEGRESLFSALDLPPEAKALQDAYWEAEHEWKELSAAYHLALHDLLRRLGKLPDDAVLAGASNV